MTDADVLLKRITIDPEVLGGKPLVRGHRMAVEHVLAYLAAGQTFESLLEGFPWMEREDILACLEYASRALAAEEVVPVG